MRTLTAVETSLRFVILRFANANLGDLDEISQLVAAISIRHFVNRNYWHPLTFRKYYVTLLPQFGAPKVLRPCADVLPHQLRH